MTDKKDSSDVVNGEPNGDTIEDAGTDKQSLVDANENLEKDDGIVEKTELETEIETQKSEEWYPDGGWGWAVVIGAVIIHVYVGKIHCRELQIGIYVFVTYKRFISDFL